MKNKKINAFKVILLVFLANFIIAVVTDWDENVNSFKKGMSKADAEQSTRPDSEQN